jgi:hypothetical protein
MLLPVASVWIGSAVGFSFPGSTTKAAVAITRTLAAANTGAQCRGRRPV